MNKLLVESHLTQGVLSKVLCLDGKALENLAFCFQIHFYVWDDEIIILVEKY